MAHLETAHNLEILQRARLTDGPTNTARCSVACPRLKILLLLLLSSFVVVIVVVVVIAVVVVVVIVVCHCHRHRRHRHCVWFCFCYCIDFLHQVAWFCYSPTTLSNHWENQTEIRDGNQTKRQTDQKIDSDTLTDSMEGGWANRIQRKPFFPSIESFSLGANLYDWVNQFLIISPFKLKSAITRITVISRKLIGFS